MTKDEILAAALDELDRMVATEVMGWHKTPEDTGNYWTEPVLQYWTDAKGGMHGQVFNWQPARNMNEAIEALDSLCGESDWWIIDRRHGVYIPASERIQVTLYLADRPSRKARAVGPIPPEAVCRAMLLAMLIPLREKP